MRNKATVAAVVVITILTIFAVVANTSHKVELHQIDLQTKQQELDLLQEKLDKNNETKAKTQKELDKQLKTNKELQKEIEALQAKKAEERRIAAEQTQNAVLAVEEAPQATPTGSCHDWMAQAGITDMANAYTIIMRESGCNPLASNPSSGAGGIPQALPYSKTGCAWGDPICQLQWMEQYVQSRYGGWQGAVNFWNANHWY